MWMSIWSITRSLLRCASLVSFGFPLPAIHVFRKDLSLSAVVLPSFLPSFLPLLLPACEGALDVVGGQRNLLLCISVGRTDLTEVTGIRIPVCVSSKGLPGLKMTTRPQPMLLARTGSVVWVKILGNPWWPATISKHSGAEHVEDTMEDRQYCVFFGDGSYCHAKPKDIKPWEEHYDEFSKKCRSALFKKALAEAQDFLDGDSSGEDGSASPASSIHPPPLSDDEAGDTSDGEETEPLMSPDRSPTKKRRRSASGTPFSPDRRASKSPIMSPPASQPHVVHSQSATSTPGGSEGVSWIGAPLQHIGEDDGEDEDTGDRYYEGFRLDDDEYHVGDCVFVRMADEADGMWVAELESLWEDKYKEKWFEGRWFYSPEVAQVHRQSVGGGGRSNQFDWMDAVSPHELYESDHVDENTLDCIEGKAVVMTETEFYGTGGRARTATPSPDTETFFCRALYSLKTRMVRPILGAAKRAQRAQLFTQRTKGMVAGNSGEDESQEDGGERAGPKKKKPRVAEASKKSGLGRGRKNTGCAKACAALQLSHVPKSLPCREKEREQIMQFLKGAVDRGGLGSALYVSGMPGTGKTATVMEVIRALKSRAARGNSPNFKFIDINGMKLSYPHQAYSIVWKALTGEDVAHKRAAMFLERRFSRPSSGRECVVLLVDELDYMVTRKQTVLYNLFDWPTRRYARLVVVGIANTMDLPERLLPRIASRLGLERVVFPGYTVPQIETIMQARLGELEVFEDTAVEICARKVAAISGDIRRALQIARRAAEICDRDAREKGQTDGPNTSVPEMAPLVTIRHINLAHKELTSTAYMLAVKSASRFERLMLAAVVLQIRSSGREELIYDDVVRRFESICRTRGGAPSQHPVGMEIKALVRRLAASGLLALELRTLDWEWQPKVRLNILMDDVVFALADDKDTRNLF